MESRYFVEIIPIKYWRKFWYLELRSDGMTISYDKRGDFLQYCATDLRNKEVYKEVKKEELPFYLY